MLPIELTETQAAQLEALLQAHGETELLTVVVAVPSIAALRANNRRTGSVCATGADVVILEANLTFSPCD